MHCCEESNRDLCAYRGLALIACALVHSIASAQAHEASELRGTASQAMFDEGRQLMEVGQYEAACAKLRESYRLDAAAGTLLNLALCHESQGRTASAWLEYHDAISLSVRENDTERQAIARDRIAA